MQICYALVSKLESEARVWAASRGMGERKTGNRSFESMFKGGKSRRSPERIR